MYWIVMLNESVMLIYNVIDFFRNYWFVKCCEVRLMLLIFKDFEVNYLWIVEKNLLVGDLIENKIVNFYLMSGIVEVIW